MKGTSLNFILSTSGPAPAPGSGGRQRESSPRSGPSVGATDKDQTRDCRPASRAVHGGGGGGHASCSQIWPHGEIATFKK